MCLLISIEYTNVADRQTLHDGTGRAYTQRRAATKGAGGPIRSSVGRSVIRQSRLSGSSSLVSATAPNLD